MATVDKISPAGFHVLTLAEIGLIQTALGVDAGGKMKTEGFEHWDDPNTGATNETGFSAVGCGKRDWNTGLFSGQRKQAMLWAADEYDTDNAGAYTMANGNALLGIAEQWNKGEGLSVRLAMDNPALFTPGMTVTDADGNTYNLVKIPISEGVDIVVTVENLRTTKYANGDPIVLAQPNNEWINAVGGAYCTFDPAPPQHALNVTSTSFKVQTKLAGGISPTIGTNFIKSLHMVATTKALTTSLKTVELRKGKILSAVSGAFTTSLKSTGFVKALNMVATVKNLALSLKTVNLIAGTTTPIVYIDPTNTASGRDGTIGNPYNSFSEVTIQSNYTYKLKLGSDFQSATRVYCNGLSNVTFNTYGTGAMPKFIYTGGGDGSTAIMFNNCNSITLDGWDVSGNNGLWAVLRNDNSNKTTINNCYLHNALWQGERGGFGIRGGGSELRILNTDITHTSNDGIYLAFVPNLEIGYVNISYVNLYEPNVPGNNQYGGDGIQINGRYNDYHIHHTVIDRNVDSIGNKYCLLVGRDITDPTLDGGIIEYCTFRANSAVLGGIILGHNMNTIIRYNNFEGPSGYLDGMVKLSGGTVKDTLIYGNRFFGITGKGITLGYSYIGTGNYGPSTGTKIYNNTFFNMAAGGGYWGCIWNDKTTVESKNNIFHMNGNTSQAHVGLTGATWILANNCYDALASVGNGGQGTDAVIGDPLFVDEGTNDFHLQIGSPCIETGVSLGLDFDYDGAEIPQGTAPCIGAFEYL